MVDVVDGIGVVCSVVDVERVVVDVVDGIGVVGGVVDVVDGIGVVGDVVDIVDGIGVVCDVVDDTEIACDVVGVVRRLVDVSDVTRDVETSGVDVDVVVCDRAGMKDVANVDTASFRSRLKTFGRLLAVVLSDWLGVGRCVTC